MENSYGIGVRNRYELFYNEDVDPMEILKKREKAKVKSAEKENKGKTAKPKDPVKKSAKTEAAPKTANKTSATGNQQKGPRTNEGRANANEGRTNANDAGGNTGEGGMNNDGRVKLSDREERNNRRNRPEGEFRDGPAPRFDGEGGRGMGRGRGRGMGRGRGRGRGAPVGDSRGKREFDRQSGMVTTGVKSIDKRDGSGSYNWGSDKDQIEEQLNEAPANSDHDSSTENVEKPADDTGATAEGEEAKEEEVVKEMTLDEWKAMQSTRSKPTFNTRRAGEGENQAQWKKTYVLKKKENVEADSGDDEPEEEVHHGRRKVVLDIDFQFADSPSRGRGRGRGRGGPGRGRGGDRMERGGGRGGGRGERRGGLSARGGRGVPHQEAPKMDDERDFPSLG